MPTIQMYMPPWMDPSDPDPDDPAAYEGLSAEWPHEANSCEACLDYEVFVESSVPERLDKRVNVAKDGERARWVWETRIWNISDFAVRWPRRHRALLDHRYAVRRAKLGAEAAPDDAGATKSDGT